MIMKSIIFVVILIISLVNSQSSNGDCIYNGIDYSNLRNSNGYSALSLASGNNQAGKYRFYWNVCGNITSKCNSDDASACQITVGSTYAPTTVGMITLGSFSNGSKTNETDLTYSTNSSPCSNGAVYRSFDINLVCSTGQLVISDVSENSKCQYTVTMSGLAACGNQTQIPTPTSTPTQTATPTQAPINGDCIYNGIDYSNLRNSNGYSALSLASGNNTGGKYIYYWNVCGNVTSKCNSDNAAACQIPIGVSSAPTTVGLITQGSFMHRTNTSEIDLTYSTRTSPCSGFFYRSFDISLICSAGPLVISGVSENSECQYTVTMSGLAACGNQTQIPTQTPTQPPINGNCIYNGVDYSNLRNSSGYSSLSSNPVGKYRFYWNVCGNIPSKCNSDNASACQVTVGSTHSPTIVGMINLGSFSNNSNEIDLTYSTNSSPCSNGAVYRSFDVKFVCGTGPLVISSVSENSKCQYTVTMSGLAACGNQTQIPTQTPTQTATPTQAPINGNCIYNGVDYSNLRNSSGYSALGLAYGNNPAGKYRYYWNVCGSVTSKCNSDNASACQTTVGSTYAPTIVGMITLGSFSNYSYTNETDLTYSTNSSPCNGNIFRSFDIKLICSAGPLVISDVSENSRCQYSVVMSGLAACGNQLPTPTQPKISCELSNNELTINSTSLIQCVGVGNTFCNIGSDVTCSTNQINGPINGSITCTKNATIYSPSSISCIGNNIKCNSLYVECSVGNQSTNLLVNGVIIKSNIYDSTTTSSNSPTTQTPNENDQSSNSSSTLLIFKNIVISILIISTTMLFL